MWDDYGTGGEYPPDFSWHYDAYDPNLAALSEDDVFAYEAAIASILPTRDVMVDFEVVVSDPEFELRGHRFPTLGDAIAWLDAIGVIHLAQVVRIQDDPIAEDIVYGVSIKRNTGGES